MKFGQGQPIRISLRATADTAQIVVTDQSIGISSETRLASSRDSSERCRRGTTTVSASGSGIVKQIVVALGNTIDVTSESGKGSVFTVQLPLRRT